jgi:CheY-like chemotaxis protein
VRILVVEDELTMAGLLQEGLREEGHDVTVSSNGREALEIASRWPFDVIVLDVMLPEMDGFSVAWSLRKSRNQTPILMLTARDSTKDLIHGLDIGAACYREAGPYIAARVFANRRPVHGFRNPRGPERKPIDCAHAPRIFDSGDFDAAFSPRSVARDTN